MKEPVQEISTLKNHCSFWSAGWRKNLKWNRQFHNFQGEILVIKQTSSPKHPSRDEFRTKASPTQLCSQLWGGVGWVQGIFGRGLGSLFQHCDRGCCDPQLVLGGILLQKLQNSPSEHRTGFKKEAGCHCPQSFCDVIGKSGSREDFPKISSQEKLPKRAAGSWCWTSLVWDGVCPKLGASQSNL